ncbi:MAG: hypothetical protein HYV63_17860 [Candidatus Schekmanbacteria bacterium]|nr:hypothetical protein [Candidatus Schekmanbacteria bacterium]
MRADWRGLEVGEVIFVKLGGSLITDKRRARTAREDTIFRLAREVAEAGPRSEASILIGHGSGSFGHEAAARAGIQGGLRGDPEQLLGVSQTQEEASVLHNLVRRAFVATGLPVFSLAPSSLLVTDCGRSYAVSSEALLGALRAGLLPLVYGDVVMDRRQGAAICSTEQVLSAFAECLTQAGAHVRELVWLGETAGVYGADGETLRELRPGAAVVELLGAVGGASGTDVTGGMRLRVETALALAGKGIPSLIADGRVPGLLRRALLGEVVEGTRVLAATRDKVMP